MLVAVQLSVVGLYLPPVLSKPGAPTPDDHFATGPHCRVTYWRALGASVVLVAIQLSVVGSYFPPVLKKPLPSLHPTRSFRCRSTLPCDWFERRRVGDAGGCPTIGGRIIPAAGIKIDGASSVSAPNDHFSAGPHCRVTSRLRARWWCWSLPNCRCWDRIPPLLKSKPLISTPPQTIISLPVQTAVLPASGNWRIGSASGRPRVVGASNRWGRGYPWKRIAYA